MHSSELDIRDLIDIFNRQRRLIILAVAVTLSLAIVYLAMATPLYRATALISIDAAGQNLLEGGTENSQSAVLNSRVDGEVEILKSAALQLAVADKADLISDPEFGPSVGLGEKIGTALGIGNPVDSARKLLGLPARTTLSGDEYVKRIINKLSNVVDIRRRGLTYLISVTIESESPTRAAEIANTYVATYIERQVQTKTEAAIGSRDVLRRQIDTARQALTASEDKLNGFIDDNLARIEKDSGDPAIGQLRRQLEAVRTERTDTLAALNSVDQAKTSADWLSAASRLGDEALSELARQRSELEKGLSAATEGSPQAIELASALARLDEGLSARAGGLRSTIDADLKAMSQNESTIRDQLRQTLTQSQLSSELVTDLFNLQQSATAARNQYQLLLDRVQNFETLANLQVADARVVSEALPPISASSPRTNLILALALVAALFIGFGLALLNEYYVGGVTSPVQLRNILQAPVPTAIPAMTGEKETTIADEVVKSPMSPYAEGFRKLRSAVDLGIRRLHGDAQISERNTDQRGQIVLICSALPGEGKSTSAIALARTYAQAGQRTLLIDCDLRRPSLANYVHVEGTTGLLQYLTSTEDPENLVIEPVLDPVSNLLIIPAGGRSNQPTDQLVNGARFRSLVRVARQSFDVIVMDSPPILPVVDTRYLAPHADAVIQVVRFANTTQGEVREAASILQEVIGKETLFLGLLSRQVSSGRKRGYYSGDYHGYYISDDR